MRVVVDYRGPGKLKSAGCSEQLFMARIKFVVLGTDLREMITNDFFFNGGKNKNEV